MRSKGWKRVRHRIEYLTLRWFLLLLWAIPLKTSLTVAHVMGWFVFSVVRTRRKVTLQNLAIAFPEKSERERFHIARKTYQNFAKMAFEFMRFPVMKREEMLSLCEIVDREPMDWALSRGKGGVLVSGHFGNWELIAGYLAQMGYPMHVVVKRQHNRQVDALMNQWRESMGIRVIYLGVALRGVIRTLREGGFVALLNDQDARREGMFVDFFGRQSSTPQGPAAFALKMGAPIVFGIDVRLPRGKHRIVTELLRYDHLKGITPENIRLVTQDLTFRLEEAIRKHPDHWFWMHKRWKTRPPEN